MTSNAVASQKAATRPPGDVGYLPVLDGWRAVAILMVLLFHGLFHSELGGSPRLKALSVLSGRLGAMGVLIFFCISGYLITLKLYSESYATGRFSVRDFYIKRFFRIIPPLACYLGVIAILGAAGVLALQREDLLAPLFLTNYINGSWYTAHFWSLSVEEHFYLFWPMCVILAGWRRAFWIGSLVIVAAGIWRPWHLAQLGDGMRQSAALQHTDMRLDYIMMGCLVALAINFWPSARRALYALSTPLGMIGILAALVLSTRHFPFDIRSVQAGILTLMVCASSVSKSSVVQAILANPVALFIGRISYSLYIWQEVILGPVHSTALQAPQALLLKMPVIVAIACLSYYLVEKPMIAYGRGLLKRQRRDQAVVLG